MFFRAPASFLRSHGARNNVSNCFLSVTIHMEKSAFMFMPAAGCGETFTRPTGRRGAFAPLWVLPYWKNSTCKTCDLITSVSRIAHRLMWACIAQEVSFWMSRACGRAVLERMGRASVDRPGLFRGPTIFCLFERNSGSPPIH